MKDYKHIESWRTIRKREENLEQLLKIGIVIGSTVALFSAGKYLYELNQNYNKLNQCPKVSYRVARFVPVGELSKNFGYNGIEADAFERVVEDSNHLFQKDGTVFPLSPGKEYKIPECKNEN